MANTIEIPNEILEAARITPDEAKVALAVQLYRQNRLSRDDARSFAGNADKFDEMVMAGEKKGQLDLNEFLDWAAHDIKTPLNAVIGFTRVVIKGIDGPLNETQTSDLTAAHTSGQRMLIYINNLIDIARLNEGKIELVFEEVDMGQILAEMATRWQNQNPKKTLVSEINIFSPKILVDNLRTRQLTASLLNYAGLHIKEGGQVTLSVDDNQNWINVIIQSNGELAPDRPPVDIAMYAHIARSLIALHDGKIDMMMELADGVLIRYSIPRR